MTITPMTYVRTGFIVLCTVVALSACHKASATDALDAAALAMGDDAFVQRCAESEYNAAIALLDEARQAEAAGDHNEARELADAARIQAERAREVAEARRAECLDEGESESAEFVSVVSDEDGGVSAELTYELTPVYFAFNENVLTPTSQATLNDHAEYLVAHPDVSVGLAGHCDERGTIAYNMALGMRRAVAVRSYLERLGVDEDRMRATSYGELQPADPTNLDLNRRVTFSVR